MKLPERESVTDDMLVFYEYDKREIFGKDTPQKYWHVSRVSEVVNTVKRNVKADSRILDVGCAQGNIPTTLSEKGYTAFGLDLRLSALKYSRLRTELAIPLTCGFSGTLPFKDDAFDCVILGELLEHLMYPEKTLKEAKRVLSDDGIIIITTPNKRTKKVRSYTESKSVKNKGKQHSIDSHVFEFEEHELIELIESKGLKILKRKRLLLANIRWKIPVSLALEIAFKLGIPFGWIKKIDDILVSVLGRLPLIGKQFYGTLLVICGKKWMKKFRS